MKTMRKTLAFLLALVLVLSLSVTAFAAGEKDGSGSITIENATVGETYRIYRIFDLESFSDENPGDPADGQYAYKINAAWADFFNSGASKDYFSVDEQGYVTWTKGADAAAFASLAQNYAKVNKMPTSADDVVANSTTVVFSDLPLGYYLVDTSLGSLCALDSTNEDVTIKDKNEKPDIDKEVQEDSDDSWGEENDADIGQTVNFRATISAKKGATNYVMHDKMSDGLTFISVTGITMNGETVDPKYYDVIRVGNELCAACTFHVNFHQDFLDTITEDSNIVVSYTAAVNEKAVIGSHGSLGNTNRVKLTYGDKQETNWEETITLVWELNIYKYTKTGNPAVETPLAGAEFVLYKTVDGINYYAQVTDGKLTGWTTVEAEATTLTSPADGFIYIDGLDDDTYFLKETKAPDGYNIMTPNPMEIVVGKDGKVGETVTVPAEGADKETSVDHVIKVLNQSGSELPSTGGIGTTIFYVVGGLLMVLAVVLLVTKKRMSYNAD